MAGTLTIGQLAEAAGVPARTIRYYEEVGVLPRPRRTASGYRHYPEQTVARLQFIRRARTLGLSLPHVRALTAAVDDGAALRPQLLELVRGQLAAVEQQIEELQLLRGELERIVSRIARRRRGQGGACRCLDAERAPA